MHYPTETLSLSNDAAYFLLLFYIPFHRLISFAITYIFILQQTDPGLPFEEKVKLYRKQMLG